MRHAIFAALLVTGCAHSLPLQLEGTQADVTVADMQFSVRYTETRAEATRTSGSSKIPSRERVLVGAMMAIERASGCKVMPGTLYGDTSLVEAYLTCPGTRSGILKPVVVYQPPLGNT